MFTVLGDLSLSSIFFGVASVKAATPETNTGQCKLEPIIVDGKKIKPCCACPETKRVRDACIIERGEENCGALIEEHKICMRKLGFKI